jgi:hypothetical protein
MPNFSWPRRRDVLSISDTSLTALLAGAKLPAGSAPQLRSLAEVLAELTSRPQSDEVDSEAEALAVFRNHLGAPSPPGRSHHRARRSLPRPLPVRAAVAAGAIVLSLAGLATAAYAGALPPPVQRLAHEIIAAPLPRARPAARPSPAVPPAARPGTSPSHRPHPARSPHGSGKPSGHPTPHGSGKPSARPTPHGSGKPSARPTPHGSGKPSGRPTPHGSGKASGLDTPRRTKAAGLHRQGATGGPGSALPRQAVPSRPGVSLAAAR